jgi:hypothetical protein
VKTINSVLVTALVLGGVSGLSVGCSMDTDSASESAEAVGQTRIPLQTTSAKGEVYRLSPARFIITDLGDPLATPQTLNAPVDDLTFTVDLPIGNYNVTLDTNWRLRRRVDDGLGGVIWDLIDVGDTLLLSPASQDLEILEQEVTQMLLAFKVGDDLIQFGEGRLEVVMTVDDGECATDSDCTDGVCDPATLACVECLADGDCAFGVCDAATLACVACESDADCAVGVCDPQAGVCFDPTTTFDDQGFEGDPIVWTLAGGAAIQPTDPGNDEIGRAFFSPTAVCEGGSVSQDLDLEWVAADGPHEMTVNVLVESTVAYQSYDRYDGGVHASFGGFLQKLPASGDSTQWREQTVCLGERAYQASSSIGFAPQVQENCSTDSAPYDNIKPLAIDNASIAPSSACPAVGEVLNGDFDAGAFGWDMTSGSSFGSASVAGGTANLAITSVCGSAYLQGQVSVPLDATLANPAIEWTHNGTSGQRMTVGMGESSPITTVNGQGTPSAVRVCLPGWAQGVASKLRFDIRGPGGSCAPAYNRSFSIDNIGVVTALQCAGSDYIADGGFESATHPGFASSWQLVAGQSGVNSTAQVDTDPTTANTGLASLRMTTGQRCANASASTSYMVPDSSGSAGPALKFSYEYSPTISSTFVSILGTLPPAATYTERTICLDPALSGSTQRFSISLGGGSGTCADTYADETLRVDDVVVTTDAACPAL